MSFWAWSYNYAFVYIKYLIILIMIIIIILNANRNQTMHKNLPLLGTRSNMTRSSCTDLCTQHSHFRLTFDGWVRHVVTVGFVAGVFTLSSTQALRLLIQERDSPGTPLTDPPQLLWLDPVVHGLPLLSVICGVVSSVISFIHWFQCGYSVTHLWKILPYSHTHEINFKQEILSISFNTFILFQYH